MTSTLIICTRNRPQICLALLRHIWAMGDQPSRVLVVEASDAAHQITASELREAHTAATLIRSPIASLPAQRNLGVSRTDAEIIHFLDDDSFPRPGYFSKMEDALNPERVVGACGHVVVSAEAPRPRFVSRVLLGSNSPGRVSKSVRNDAMRSSLEYAPVDWTPGCCMSFKSSVLSQFQFDERLADGPLKGYAMGEDVEFSWRASRKGALVWVRDALVDHELSDVNRADGSLMSGAAAHFRARMAARHPRDFSQARVTADTGGRILLALVGRSSWQTKRSTARSLLQGLSAGRKAGRSER
jgi:hypothetical protein